MEKIKEIISSFFGIPILTEEQLSSFDNLAEILVEENKKVNVTSIVDPVGIATKHFADSLSILQLPEMKKEGIKMADIGCGGGFPGLPIKIARPDIDITMVDSTEKKIRYVKATAEKLGLEKVTTVAARAEDVAGKNGSLRERFDVVTARAMARLNVLVELCMPFVKVGGTFISMKAATAEEELLEAKAGIVKLGGRIKRVDEIKFDIDTERFPEDKEALLDFVSAKRYMIVIEKVKSTPPVYPRLYSAITKKPL